MTHKLVAAAVQLHAGADRQANLAKAEGFVRQAAAAGAGLVVLPEVFAWRGPQSGEHAIAESIPGPSSERMAALADECRIHLLAGSLHEAADGDKVFNTSLLFGPDGATLARYRKIHLFDVDIAGQVTIRESDSRRAGDQAIVAQTSLGTIGMSVCYDLRFPELYRQLTFAGARIIVVPSAFTFTTGSAHWETLLRARAIENQVYIVAANQIGAGPGGVADYGNSMIVDPWGRVVARAGDREMTIYGEIDFDYQDKVRRQLPCLQHVRLAP
ncbi:MAG TPA: carbon-nitrogen hydrolase family protein [Terriglobales bacterium]|nr:carbon-nitrogen hydrolase family protein [Terriglobales bacterium]